MATSDEKLTALLNDLHEMAEYLHGQGELPTLRNLRAVHEALIRHSS